MRNLIPFKRLRDDQRGLAATEFALIAPALIFLVMGVMEMSFRFRASEEATRYVHQVADLVSRENDLTSAALEEIHEAAVHMMKPLDTAANLHLDVASIGFEGDDATPAVFWRRVAGTEVTFDVDDTAGMGEKDESVIRVAVRYNYQSILSDMFGGGFLAIEKVAFARPRENRLIEIDNTTDDGGSTTYLGG